MLRVLAPATTANLGAGFDCLGLALTLYNEVEVEEADGLSITISGEGADELPRDETNLVWRAAGRVFERVGRGPRGARLRLVNHIPLESGLGSSAAATVAGLLAGNALLGGPLDHDTLLALAVAMEGHPDNVAPALLGGLAVVGRADDGAILARRVALSPVQAVVVMPDFRLATAVARAALPKQVSMADAVYNIGRAALTLVAFAQGDYTLLAQAMGDRLHQPYRAPLVPGLAGAIAAAQAMGAAAAISGAGPAVIAFAPGSLDEIGAAMQAGFAEAGIGSRRWVLDLADGASVED